MTAVNRRRALEVVYWLFVVVFLVIYSVLRFYWPAAAIYRDTYQLPVASPGALVSDFWTWDFIREGLYVFSLLIPFSGLFMVWTRNKEGQGTHIIVLFIFLFYFAVMAAFDVRYIINANVPPTNPHWVPTNLATDRRWCCVYASLPLTERICANTALCPGVTAEMLTIDPSFLFRVIMNGILLLYVIVDMLFTLCAWSNRLNEYLEEIEPLTKTGASYRYERYNKKSNK